MFTIGIAQFRALLIALLLLSFATPSLARRGESNALSSQQHEQFKTYFSSGTYFSDIERKLTDAQDYLDRQLQSRRKAKLAIVFDVDETVLSNFHDLERLAFTRNPQALTGIYMLSHAQAIPPVLALYQHAIANKVAIFFVSERPDTPEINAATAKNLKEAGFEEWEALNLKPLQNEHQSTQEFKTAARRYISALGYDIVLNIGDQDADLQGGYAEARVKMPNPFYENA